MPQLLDAASDASATSALVHIPNENSIFKEYRYVVKDAYKDLKDVQRYQIFSMRASSPGVVSCKKGPSTSSVDQDLRRKYDGILTDSTRVQVLFTSELSALPNPPPNAEKIQQIYTKVRPYVPEEFADDPLYAAPSSQQEQTANTVKRARAERRKETAKKKREDRAAAKNSNQADSASEEKPGSGGTEQHFVSETSSNSREPAAPKSVQRPRK
ncbi:unnamed protein product [Phytophthora fragariaefolia]|uniref:Unnamed protein product n=1 Tax=Phytophthora fragariaefolia TaxID=1490495 RepID=A0A9W6XBQ3_9STRA|nr:unnamed protein product [Phytophthora fragariaefolia]